ncbi:MAG: BamA/TamA family outer membrane protein [Deltaproteobacteria bacterium]|nr:BamA/TamA family outer membrane protein [Deltaproteobacteria bacterium]
MTWPRREGRGQGRARRAGALGPAAARRRSHGRERRRRPSPRALSRFAACWRASTFAATKLEGVDVRGNERTSARVILRYVRFRAGDTLDVSDPELELTRYRLLGTGFFSSVRLSLRKGSERGRAVLVVDVVERNTLVVENVWMGVAADEDTDGNAKPLSPYLGLSLAETNLAGTGITLGAGVGLAADQWALRTRFADPDIGQSGWVATASLQYIDARDFLGAKQVSFESPELELRKVTDYAVVGYKRFGGSIGAGHDLSLSTQILLEYQLEQVEAVVPVVASHVRGQTREPIDFDVLPGDSVLSVLRAAVVYDTRDTPILTTRGTLATIRLGLGLAPLGSSYGFEKLELGLQHWWRLPWGHVASFEGQGGAIAGAPPFFEKFYVGDYTDLLPGRILGLNPDRRRPPNFLGTDIVEVRYGDYAAKLEGEYRVPLYTGRGAVYGVDFFAATGLYAVATRRDLTQPPSGYEGAERVPVDLTYNLGLRVETYVGGFGLSFSNLLGLLPARGGGRK